ncbi:MAG: hypothetical protein HRT83_01345 [Hyphomicrobiaceae bacterium]|nr:hypothetical protein [Hyphomicrobiaceae bacterium]
MCTILKFVSSQTPKRVAKVCGSDLKTADIIFFPGVRYEVSIGINNEDLGQAPAVKRDILIL